MKYLMYVDENESLEPVDIKFSAKSITIKPLGEKPFYTNGCIDELWDKGKIVVKIISDPSDHRVWKHYLKDWNDGTYTLYPSRAGIPYLLEPCYNKTTSKSFSY